MDSVINSAGSFPTAYSTPGATKNIIKVAQKVGEPFFSHIRCV